MTTDQLVRRALRDLTENVQPDPEPAARVRRRLRKSRQRRGIGASLATVVAVGVGWAVVPSSIGDDSGPSLTPRQVWSQRLYEAAPRGGVASTDPDFVQALEDEAERAANSGLGEDHVRAPRVLYADDIGTHRIAIVAFELTGSDASLYTTMTYSAARGADAAAVVQGNNGSQPDLPPLYTASFLTSGEPTLDAVVSLAPPGCVVATAPTARLDDWRTEATGSYLVRDGAGVRPEWVRVTCDGVLRQETPIGMFQWPRNMSDEQLAQLSHDARGTVNQGAAQDALSNLKTGNWSELLGEPRLLWGGALTWPKDSDNQERPGSAVIVVQPLVRGSGWAGDLAVRYDQPDSAGRTGMIEPFLRSSDPTAANAVVPVELGVASGRVAVLVPPAAVGVRAVSGGRTVAESNVENGVAVVTVPSAGAVDYQALEGSGRVIGSGRIEQPKPPQETDTWDQP
jgi:hypothetical protein